MKKLIYVTMLLTLFLAACGKSPEPVEENVVERKDNATEESESSHEESKDDASEDESDSKNVDEATKKEKEDEPLIKKEELTLEQIVAMTIIDQRGLSEDAYVAPTAEELLNHTITNTRFLGSKPTPDLKVNYLGLLHVRDVKAGVHEDIGVFLEPMPYDISVFLIEPTITNARSVIAIGEEKVLLYLSQAPTTYEGIVGERGTGHEYDIDELYENNKNNEQVLELENMIKHYDTNDDYRADNPGSHPSHYKDDDR